MVDCCTITQADLRVRVFPFRRVRTADGYGGWEETWVGDPAGGILAKIQNLTGTERWEAQRTESTNLLNAFVRFRGDENGAPYWHASETILRIRGREYNVLAVTDMEMKKRWLKMLIQEGDPA